MGAKGKKCMHCQIRKPREEFDRDAHTRSGRDLWCATCMTAYFERYMSLPSWLRGRKSERHFGTRCKYCGEVGLRWREDHKGRMRLHDEVGLHHCKDEQYKGVA